MELVDLYDFRMRLITKALDAHKEDTMTALAALGWIRTIINMPNAEVVERYITYRQESEPEWQPPQETGV